MYYNLNDSIRCAVHKFIVIHCKFDSNSDKIIYFYNKNVLLQSKKLQDTL